MKLKNLLILGAMLLSVGGASAAIQERQKPALPEPIEAFTDGTTSMYMYNVGAERFFCGSNSWGTQTSIGDEGYRVYFEQYVVDAEAGWDGTTVIFKDSCLAKEGALKEVFFDKVDGGCFVDRGSQANRYWKLQKNAGNAYYRLSMAECNNDYQAWQVDAHPNTFWGWDSANGTVVSSFLDPNIETVHVDWGFCTLAAYDAYQKTLEVYNASEHLKALILDAQSKGLDVTSLEAVYNNLSATVEDINDAIASFEELTVDPMNPLDKTSFIVNPNMDDTSGWTTIDGVQNRTTHTNLTGTGVYTEETSPAFEHWNGSAYTGKFYQVIAGVPNGLYKLRAAVMGDQDPAAEGTGLYLYANEGKTPVVSNIPTYYTVFAEVVNDTIEIGWTAEIKHSKWISTDTYTLFYYGNKGEATYTGALAGIVNENLTKFDGREAEMTVGTIDTYKATLNGLVATDLEALNAAIVAVGKAADAVQANIDGWVAYRDLLAEAQTVRGTYASSESMTALTRLIRTATTDLTQVKLTTEELLAAVETMRSAIDKAVRDGVLPGTDVTDRFLVNARYDNGTTGWSGTWTAVNYGCMEAYERDWDAYQIVKDAPQGVYEISLQGFYRVKRGQEAYDLYLNGGQICPGHVYVNNHLNEVKCVFTEPVKHDETYIYTAVGTGPESNPNAFIGEDGDSIFFPNDMQTAGEAFNAGMYVSSANGIVAQDGDELRIGVKGKKQTGTWVIWDNFKMVYRGKEIEYTMPYLQEAVAAAGETLQKPMDVDTRNLLEAAKANGEAHLSSTDKDAVFNALVQIYAANDSVEASVALFAELDAAAAEISDAMITYEGTATQAALIAATALYDEITGGLTSSSLTKADAAALLARVDKVVLDLKMPDVAHASDDTPVEFTHLISTPDFENGGTNSAEGWTGATGSYGPDDQKGALAYEFYQKTFDIYQELNYLPNGTYRIEVSAFNRHGNSLQDYDSYQLNPDSSSAYVYGMDCAGDSLTYKSPVVRASAHAAMNYISEYLLDQAGFAAVDTLKDVELGADSIMWIPNNVMNAVTLFTDFEYYKNTVYAEVTNGTLRIGMKKDVQVANDWVILDTWKLFYHGTASQFKPTSVGEIFVAAPGAPVKVEVYNLNGVRLNSLQKGVNIIRTIHADGQVTVKKRLVK